ITDDSECGLVSHDGYALDSVKAVGDQLGVRGEQVDGALQGPRRLVLIETKFNVHTHHGKVRTTVGKNKIERAIACFFPAFDALGRGFKKPPNRFGVAEYI